MKALTFFAQNMDLRRPVVLVHFPGELVTFLGPASQVERRTGCDVTLVVDGQTGHDIDVPVGEKEPKVSRFFYKIAQVIKVQMDNYCSARSSDQPDDDAFDKLSVASKNRWLMPSWLVGANRRCWRCCRLSCSPDWSTPFSLDSTHEEGRL